MTLRLLLIRHGLSSYNLVNRIQGRNDLSTLTKEGFYQASKTGEALEDLNISVIYSSPLQRAVETAKEILINQKSSNLILDNDLLEVDLDQWSGLTFDEIKIKSPNLYKTWKESPHELTLTRDDGSNYQPIKELMEQAERFLKKIFSTHKTETKQNILVVGHNAILRCLILKILNGPEDGLRRLRLDNSSISIFNIDYSKNNQLSVQVESLNSTAHLKPKLPLKGKSARIILVRHGETDWNKEGRFQGQIDIPLNSNGKQQALAAGEMLEGIKFDKAYSSSMTRPMETAQIILKDQPNLIIQKQTGLVEIGHGLWEGKLESEINSKWNSLLSDWKQAPETVQMPEGESLDDVSNRAITCWESICKNLLPHETALVVAHDAVNKTILCNILGLTNADIWKIKQGNGGITIIDITQSSTKPNLIACLNITSHLGGVIDNTAQGAL